MAAKAEEGGKHVHGSDVGEAENATRMREGGCEDLAGTAERQSGKVMKKVMLMVQPTS